MCIRDSRYCHLRCDYGGRARRRRIPDSALSTSQFGLGKTGRSVETQISAGYGGAVGLGSPVDLYRCERYNVVRMSRAQSNFNLAQSGEIMKRYFMGGIATCLLYTSPSPRDR